MSEKKYRCVECYIELPLLEIMKHRDSTGHAYSPIATEFRRNE
jgi:hypothetical protein